MAESSKGKAVEEMTHSEHVEYLEEEAEKQADHNREQFEKQQEAYKATKESGTASPTEKTNDELRAENAKAVDAELDATTGGGEPAPAAAKKPASAPAPATHKPS